MAWLLVWCSGALTGAVGAGGLVLVVWSGGLAWWSGLVGRGWRGGRGAGAGVAVVRVVLLALLIVCFF